MSTSDLAGARKPRIQSLARADAILSAVMAHEGPASLSTLSEALQLNKTTVFNLAESLVMLGFLQRATRGKGYQLGLRCLELGRQIAKKLPILEISRPSLRAYVTHADWSDAWRGAVGGPAYATDTQGTNIGIQVEYWW